jgi:hypothetical protein
MNLPLIILADNKGVGGKRYISILAVQFCLYAKRGANGDVVLQSLPKNYWTQQISAIFPAYWFFKLAFRGIT